MSNFTNLQLMRVMFYGVTPNETTFKSANDVPSYISEVTPIFLSCILFEYIIAGLRGLPKMRLNDGMNSVVAGASQQLSKFIVAPFRLFTHAYIYNNYRVINLQWDSVAAWWICLIGVDFLYYWFHRAAHEINIFWAGHQTHHSSEDYNLTTALRQSILQDFFSWIFYIPLAFAVPTPIFMVHVQFNTIYQFWIHTEVVDKLGPLEYILNTPSHHRVHHGRNPYCIDKNYAGTLIIWDRMFGTFQEEKEEEKVAYGLVHPLNTWDPIHAQFCHFVYVIKRTYEVEGFQNKISTIIKGPGWAPGTSWTGDPAGIPEIECPVIRYDSAPSTAKSIYVAIHGIFLVIAYMTLTGGTVTLSVPLLWGFIGFFFLTVTSFGMIFDQKPASSQLEFCRCLIFLLADLAMVSTNVHLALIPQFLWKFVRILYIGSVIFWLPFVAKITEKLKMN